MPVVATVEGLRDFQRALKAAQGDLDKELRKALRGALSPIVADAKARFAALPGTGRRTASQVRGSVTQNGVAVTLTAKGGYELGREFGAKGPRASHYQLRTPHGTVGATRVIDYSRPRIFGPWTGNRFSLDGFVSGHAFYPAASAGGKRAAADVEKALAAVVDRLGD